MNRTELEVFIECEAGTRMKRRYDEETLECTEMFEVPADYPYPYGFVRGTRSEDGGGVDCYVITGMPLRAGQMVRCEPVGLMEQFEGEEIDHKVLARLAGEMPRVDEQVQRTLAEFTRRLCAPYPSLQVRGGRFLDRAQAEAYIAGCRS